jgi:hypothetical protein
MIDMENVIKDNAIRGLQNVIEISGALVHLRKEYAKVILELLKEQDPVEPKKEDDGNPEPWASWWYVCGDCGQPIDKMDRYCRRCGKQVKWE